MALTISVKVYLWYRGLKNQWDKADWIQRPGWIFLIFLGACTFLLGLLPTYAILHYEVLKSWQDFWWGQILIWPVAVLVTALIFVACGLIVWLIGDEDYGPGVTRTR